MSEPPPPPSTPPPSTPPPPPPPGGPPPGAPPPGWQQPGPPYATAPQTDGLAIGALVTAIAGIFVCSVVPIASVVAIVLAIASNNKIKSSGGRLTGEGMNKASLIISWIWIGLSVLFWVVIIIVAIAGGFEDNNDNDIDFDSLRTVGTYLAARFG